MVKFLIYSILILLISFNINFSLLLNNSSIHNQEYFDESILKRVKLYLPEYQNKYSRINELNDTNFNFSKIRNSRNVLLIPDNIIESYNNAYQIQKLSSIIENFIYSEGPNDKKVRYKYNSIYSDEYTFYGDKKKFFYDHNYIWHKFIKPNTEIYEKSTSIIKNVIETEPEMLDVDNQICSIQKIIFHIKNPDPEVNLLIKNIKSDIYQIKIFPYLPSKSTDNNSRNPNITYTIPPKGTFILQILALPDIKNIIYGTLYIEFNNKKVLLIPIKVNGKENQFRVNPIYQIDAQIKKYISIPIKIFNPSQKVMVIKKVMHSFEKINIFWPNGSNVVNNANLPSSSIFQIQPRSSKNIMYIKYYSPFPYFEYGLIRLKTDNGMIVIPVLFNNIDSPIITYPKYFNFGLCQVSAKSKYNFKKIIPLTLYNKGIENIKIGKVYLGYENIFIQFHQNFNGNNIIIAPNEEIKYGHLIFDGNVMKKMEKRKKKLVGKLQKGSIYIETNSTDCPFIQVNYSYFADMGEIEQIVSGNIQQLPKQINNFNFMVNVKYNHPYGLEIMSNYNIGENMTIYDEKYVTAKIINPSNEEQSHDINILFEIGKSDIFHFKRLFYLPIRLTHCLYSFIPIQLDNNDINIVYCGNEESSKSLASCMRTFGSSNMFDNLKNESHKIINFKFSLGVICPNVKIQRFLYIVNENSSPVSLEAIKTDNKYITLNVEELEYLGNDDYPENIENLKKDNFTEILRENLLSKKKKIKNSLVMLPPKMAVKISINLFTTINENLSIKGKNTIIYNNNSKFVIDNTAIICKGNINVSPSSIRFEPAFPNFVHSTIIFCKNNMEYPLTLFSVNSNDERIIPSLLTYEVGPNNRTEIIKIIFDPSKTNFFKTYMNVVDLSSILTYKELYLWKEKEKYWNKLGETGRTEINANVTLHTSFGKKEINVGSFLIRPSLVKNDTINFGLVQIGKLINNYIEIFNPSDKVLMVKLVLAPNEYGDINNNEMFAFKDQNLFNINEELILLGCSFSGWVGNSQVTKFEYIILQENINPINLRRGLIHKNKLIKLLYEYGSHKVKNYLVHGYKAFCKYEKKFKNELIVNNNYKNVNAISELHSKNFEKEIEEVKNLTTKDIKSEDKKEYVKEETLWEKICEFFLNLYIKYYLRVSINTEVEIKETNQPFYLSNSVYNQIYQISPREKSTLGPILFRPNQSGNITGTLFLKNNLTILYPVKLIGVGGGGEASFFSNYEKNQLSNSHIINKTNYIIEVDELAYNTELKQKEKITRTITVKNTGNLLMNVKNISIDGFGCETDEMKILQCDEFILYPEESLDIDIEIKPNINNYITNKNVYFNTDYQSFALNVIIFIAKEIYIKNNMIRNHVISMTLILTMFIIFFLIIKTILRIINFRNNKDPKNDDDDKLLEKNNENKNKNYLKQNTIKKENEKNNEKNKKENNYNYEINSSLKIEENKNENNIRNEIEKENEKNNEEKKMKNSNKNKKKKNKKNRKISEASNNSNSNTYTDNISLDKNIEEKEEEKEETKEEKNEKEQENEEIKQNKNNNINNSNKDNYERKNKNENIMENYSPSSPKKKKSKKKNLNRPFGMEETDKNDHKKNISKDDKNNTENDSSNDIKNTNSYNKTIPIPIKKRKNSNNYNQNSIPGIKEKKKPKSNIIKKNYNNYNYYNNYNNYNNYYMQEEKRPIATVKRDKNISNLNELFNMMSEKDKKESKSTKKDNLKNNDINNISKIEIDCSNSIFNFDGFFFNNKNDTLNTSKINFRDESVVSNEDIKENEEIRNYFNESLMEKIENPFFGDDKNEQMEMLYNKDKSKFFNYDFFGDDKNNND